MTSVWIRPIVSLIGLLVLAGTPASASDWRSVGEWDSLRSAASSSNRAAGGDFIPAHLRSSTGLYLAMFSAMNAVDGRYQPYFEDLAAAPGADAEMSGHYAAAAFIGLAYPSADMDAVNAAIAAAAEGLDADTVVASEATGAQAAALAFEAANATFRDVMPYRPYTIAGRWVPTTPPAFRNGLGHRPFLYDAPEDLAPPGPPALDSDQWAADFNEVRELGGENSTLRTEAQAYEANFWIAKDWEPLVMQLAERRNWSMLEAVRVYSLVAMATSDAGLTTGWAKDHFQFWRPITAIRNADLDDREDTGIEAGWEPLLETPRHPEYPCAHCSYGSAVSSTLSALVTLEPGETLDVYAFENPDEVQTITNLWEFSQRMSMSRLYGGVHYRTSNDHADEIGRRAGEMAVERYGRPVGE
ncbi:vanadium-dependent haloperoxidase [Hyphobacterium sp. HN65]|uniref:Vanadium-dependent haloperoxidase n=1 Tax=Hyphobacterium lacteum TaxID=3116575 RepID=A0ABU7LQW9_9PROT|nr:vanadium-dependent haloperoxidase [Hyphobacterium sp. HN65]MEE2526303.1 vanadium-dependent haloperoxidase [Hyphobacterium sp. HN65]